MIRDAYDLAAKIIRSEGFEPENIEVAEVVERLRLAWKPRAVRVVLLAESHVWTAEDEVARTVQLPTEIEPTLDRSFARFVYCLGYGEKTLAPEIPHNSGTWQYWRLFHDTVRKPVVSGVAWGRNPTERVRKKVELLKQLREAGIWLVDASITALYRPSKGPLLKSRSNYKKVLQASWEAHVRDVIADCRGPAVLIVGRGVDDAIGDLVRRVVPEDKVDSIYQPNAHLRRRELWKYRLKLFELCRLHSMVSDRGASEPARQRTF
jgi:hypothetical protein